MSVWRNHSFFLISAKWKDYPIAITATCYFFGAIYMGLASTYFLFTNQVEEFRMPRYVRIRCSLLHLCVFICSHNGDIKSLQLQCIITLTPPTLLYCTHTHTHTHAYTHTRMHACTYAPTHARTHTCMHARIYVCMHAHTLSLTLL